MVGFQCQNEFNPRYSVKIGFHMWERRGLGSASGIGAINLALLRVLTAIRKKIEHRAVKVLSYSFGSRSKSQDFLDVLNVHGLRLVDPRIFELVAYR